MIRQSRRTLLQVLLLAAVLIAGFIFRSWFAAEVMPPPRRMQAETTQSYRYARIFSETGSIPSLDTLVMHPEGMRTFENSIFEEYIAGGLHRITGGDFDDFMRVFCLFFPLLVIPFLYLWMRSAGCAVFPSAASSSLYAFLLPALLRARGESLYRETVALPLLVTLAWLVESGLRKDGERRAVRISSGLLLFLCLAAWKVSAFLSFFLLLYLFWRHWRRGNVPFTLRISLSAAQISAALLLPHMRHDGAILSPATVIALFLLLPRVGTVWLPMAATAAAALSAFIGPNATGHVTSVITAKLRFLFSHPEDPSLLSDDARLFWVPGYDSPSPAEFLLLFGIPVAAAVPGILDFFREKRDRLIFWFLPISLAGYLFFDRLMVFLAIAMIPVIALTFRRRWMVLPVSALIVLNSVFPAETAGILSGAGLDFRDHSSLLGDPELDSFLAWLRHDTESGDAVLSFWHISGLVSAYAGRPVVTHTFFENEENRRTIVRFAETMFMPEDSLVAFMRRRDARFVVHQADFILDRDYTGLLYLAGRRTVPPDAAALFMQYSPERLDSLVLVFQGPSLRVFELKGEREPDLRREFLYVPRYTHLYDGYDAARSILADMRASSGLLADRALETGDPDMMSAAMLLGLSGGGPADVMERMLEDLIRFHIDGMYDLDHLAEDIESFVRRSGERPSLRLLLARLFAAEERFLEAAVLYGRVLEVDPANAEAAAELMMITRERSE